MVSAFVFKTLLEEKKKIVGRDWTDLKMTWLVSIRPFYCSGVIMFYPWLQKKSIMLMPIIKNLADALLRVCLHTNKDMMMYKTETSYFFIYRHAGCVEVEEIFNGKILCWSILKILKVRLWIVSVSGACCIHGGASSSSLCVLLYSCSCSRPFFCDFQNILSSIYLFQCFIH